jgi:hypothetical protein
MAEQTFFTLGEAAKATGKSKATISNAIKTGRLSVYERTASGYRIAAAELFRVFTPNSSINSSIEQTLTPESNALNGLNRALEREIEILREERERERQQAQSTIDDLRRRIDATDEERRRLTVLLTDQTAHKPSWWDRLRGRSR